MTGRVVFHSTRVLLSFGVPAGPSINGASHARAVSHCGSRRRDHVCVLSGRPGTCPERAGFRDRHGHAAGDVRSCSFRSCSDDARSGRSARGNDTRACCNDGGAGSSGNHVSACDIVIDGDHEGFERHADQGNQEKEEDDPATGDRPFDRDRYGALALSQLGAEGISEIHSVRQKVARARGHRRASLDPSTNSAQTTSVRPTAGCRREKYRCGCVPGPPRLARPSNAQAGFVRPSAPRGRDPD
jgi:hypothetical protein